MGFRRHFRPLTKILLVALLFTAVFYGERLYRRESSDQQQRTIGKRAEQTQSPFYIKKHPFHCGQIIANNTRLIDEARRSKREVLTDYECFELFDDCDMVLSRHYYPTEPDSDEERDFPIAYVIMIHEDLEQVEMLLNVLYAPQNLYCFHVDVKAPRYVHSAMERLSRCFANVLVTSSSFPITRVTSFTIDAFVTAIEDLYRFEEQRHRPPWKYLITLQNHDFPLKTNLEIVRILTLYGGFNDVELNEAPWFRTGKFYEYRRNAQGIPDVIVEANFKRGPPPFNVTLYKGSVVASLSRPFVDQLRKHSIIHSLKSYLKFTFFGDELFWSTLSHNERLHFPGTYPGRCARAGRNVWVSRFAVWQYNEYLARFRCLGQFRNQVCVQSTADLTSVVYRPELFLNKVAVKYDPIAIDCLHQLIFHRRYRYAKVGAPNMTYYERTSAVQYRKWLDAANPPASFTCVVCKNCAH